ncbi:MAG: c-type cytochrome [Azonexus sp.]|nr:c-type cytochrome [Azonexus sp.]
MSLPNLGRLILCRRRLPSLVIVLLLILGAFSVIAWRGFAFVPGHTASSSFCAADLGSALDRQGHSEQVLWRGCLIASDTQRALGRFVPPGNHAPACLGCHDGTTAPGFALLWSRFPYRDAKGKIHDLAGAIREEIKRRYDGVPPNRADNVVTALYFYAAAKAGQAGLRYAVDTPQQPLFEQPDLASDDCRRKFDTLGWPRGDNAPAVVAGCNLVTETPRHVSAPIARAWGSRLSCQSCHLEAGDRVNAASLAHGAVVLPHMLTSLTQPVRFDRRVLMCFARSLNWLDFGLDAPEINPINIYANWLAQRHDLPIGVLPPGRGMPLVYDAQGRGVSFLAGENVYRERCQACHGPNGLGGRVEVGGRRPPPLAGPESFTAAATTSDPFRMAGFIHANMPPGASLEQPQLSHQEALDIAAYLTRLGRPADFTRANALDVFFNYLWINGVTKIAVWLGDPDADSRRGGGR